MITSNLLQTSSKYFWEHTEGIFHVLFSCPMTVMILFPSPSSPAVTLLDKVMPLMPKSPSYAADAQERDYWCWCLTEVLLPGSVSTYLHRACQCPLWRALISTRAPAPLLLKPLVWFSISAGVTGTTIGDREHSQLPRLEWKQTFLLLLNVIAAYQALGQDPR